ncbi:MAG: type I-U CRISPR-associated protein Cas7 [Planctomycetota bacterium]|nr:MAG: type I-U CRISPR-associated protein Cas7 [Planctomycetota bacterium]REK40305.1 MAG: type I-U CRISPR-associated protein Cas7 [Planctomycetota bacterium]
MASLTLEILQQAVRGTAAAFRCRAELQPAGGEGTKVFPPTYAGAVYATENRRLPNRDEPVPCVLLDSVQSQANRMEEALQQAVDDGRLKLPVVEVDFTDHFPGDDKDKALQLLDPVGRVSSLELPHRIADAILRDSELDGTPFRETNEGKRIYLVNLRNATALFELCPTALLFGMWDSTGPKGGLGAKFERAMVSEIVGIDAVLGVKTSSRVDPLAIQLKAGPLYETVDGGWTLDSNEAKQEKKKPKLLGKDGRPSEANHGNVTPSLSDVDRQTGEYLAGGVTIAKAEQTIVLSLPALRRLRFPGESDDTSPERDNAARTVLAALGLCAAALADDAGLDLRSRCLLYPDADLTWELLDRKSGGQFTLPVEDALKLLSEAVDAAKKAGLPWREEPLTLKPSEQLVKLVVKSQQLAAQQGGGE